MSEQDSCYSNDEEYFLDVCRSGEIDELKQFVETLPKESTFDWSWFNNKNDNFMHMLAANNLHAMFDYLVPVVQGYCSKEQIFDIVNKTNSSGSTPLHYAVITDSLQMIERFLKLGADPNIKNDQERTPFQEAMKFGKIQIAEILAPISANNLEQLKKEVEGLKLNDNNDSSEEEETEKVEQLSKIEEKEEKDEEQEK